MIQKNKQLTEKTEVFSDSDSDGGVSMDSEDEMNMLESAMSSSNNPWMKATKLSRPTGYEKIQEVKNEDKILLPEEDSENESVSADINVEHVEFNIVNDDNDKNNGIKKLSKHKAKAKHSAVEVDNIDELFKEFESEDDKNSQSIHENKEESRKKKRNRKKREKEKKKKLLKEIQTKQEDEDEKEESVEESYISEKLERKTTMEDFENEVSDDETGNDIRTRRKQTENEIETNRGHDKKEEDLYVDPKKLLNLESKLNKSKMPDMVVDDDDIDDEEQQRMTIAQAFADDDVIEEFSQEKKNVVNRDKPKDIDLTLPGWGEWGGTGIKLSKKKKKR